MYSVADNDRCSDYKQFWLCLEQRGCADSEGETPHPRELHRVHPQDIQHEPSIHPDACRDSASQREEHHKTLQAG